MKSLHNDEGQLTFDLSGECSYRPAEDEYCYTIFNIASYVQEHFCGMENVPLSDIWALLDAHPVFPSDGYKPQIKSILKQDYGAQVSRQTITFSNAK